MVEVLPLHARHAKRLLARHPRGLAVGEVAHLCDHHVLGGLARSPHVNGLLGAVLGALGAGEDDGAARVRHEADVQEVEGIADRPRAEHIRHRDGIAVARLGIERGPLSRGHRHLRPLLQGGAVLVHVPRRDHPEVGGRSCEAVRDFELPGEAGVAAARDPHPRPPRLPVRDHRHVAEPVVERGHRVTDHHDEGAAAHGGAVHVARRDAERLAEQRGGVLTGGEDPVHVGHLEAGVTHGVGDCFQVQGELALVRQDPDLVALVHADDAGGIRQCLHARPPAAPARGRNSGSVNSSLSVS